MRTIRTVIWCFAVVCSASSIGAQTAPAAPALEPRVAPRTDNPLRDGIDSAVHRGALQLFAATRVVGMSVGVATPAGARTYGYGRTSLGDERVPTAKTRYSIASITKTFTATLLARAAVEGRIGLDDDIRRYLPGDYPNLAFAGHPIRVRHLITHLSGLPRNVSDSSASVPGGTRARLLAELHHVVLDTVPGVRFAYSNAAAQLLGFILEDIHHRSFAQLVESRIARPLRMSSTRLALSGADRSRMAVGYDSSGKAIDVSRFEALQAAGALSSTVTDMLAYLRWHAAERDSAVRLTHAPTLSMGEYQIGLNWQMMSRDGRRTIWQDGGLPGYTSLAAFSPELDLRVAILTTGHDYTNGLSVLASGILTALDRRAVPLP